MEENGKLKIREENMKKKDVYGVKSGKERRQEGNGLGKRE